MKADARIGKRIRLHYCADAYSPTPPGLEGTITLIDDTGTVHARWDDGSTLGLIPGVDRWEELS